MHSGDCKDCFDECVRFYDGDNADDDCAVECVNSKKCYEDSVGFLHDIRPIGQLSCYHILRHQQFKMQASAAISIIYCPSKFFKTHIPGHDRLRTFATNRLLILPIAKI